MCIRLFEKELPCYEFSITIEKTPVLVPGVE